MKRNTFKPIVIITLIVGAVAIAFLLVYRGVPSQSLAVSLPNFNISEETEEYAVYSTLLNEMFVEDGVNLLVIQKQTLFYANPDYLNRTTTEERITDIKNRYSSVSEDTLRDYETKQMQSSTLSPNFNLPVKYILVDESEIKKDKDGSRIDPFYKKEFSGARGMISLSKVGFNKDRNEAFVLVEFIFCPLCSRSDSVLLEKKFGVWKVKENFSDWVS